MVADRAQVAVSVERLSKHYERAGRRVSALSGVDLDVVEGELLVLLGPSGCGKTTLLRILGGLIEPSEGTLRFAGYGGDGGGRADLGFVFQEDNLLPWRTVAENVELPLQLRKVPRSERRETVARMLELVGLEGAANALPRQLSGGMRQRASIARALSFDPRMLLMDEPFGALDAQTRDQLNVELQRLWMASRKTIVLVTHSIPEAVFLGERVVVMASSPGRVIDVVTPGFERPRSLDLIATPAFNATVAALRARLVEA
jgi:NitT/TauT family transport system ATP-binding protein